MSTLSLGCTPGSEELPPCGALGGAAETLVGRRVLVTGAAGFIGSHLSLALAALGARVTAIDNFNNLLGQADLKASRAEALRHAGIEVEEFDLLQGSLTFLADCDLIFHLAALPGLAPSWQFPNEYYANNVLATVRLADSLRNLGHAAHIVHVSTSSVYGAYATGDEHSPLLPTSPYGASKLAAEIAVGNLLDGCSTTYSILRYFSVFGPGQRPDMAYAKFVNALLAGDEIEVTGTGLQSRTNTFVTDIVGLTIEVGTRRLSGIYNVGGPVGVTVNEALSVLGQIAGAEVAIRHVTRPPGDQEQTRAVLHSLETQLGLRRFVGPAEGLEIQFNSRKSSDAQTHLFGASVEEYMAFWMGRVRCSAE